MNVNIRLDRLMCDMHLRRVLRDMDRRWLMAHIHLYRVLRDVYLCRLTLDGQVQVEFLCIRLLFLSTSVLRFLRVLRGHRLLLVGVR